MATSSSLLSIFATAIAPIVAIAAVGYLLGSLRDIDVAPLNTVTIYVLVPALIFHSLVSTTIDGETLLKVTGGVVLFLFVMAGLAERGWPPARRGRTRKERARPHEHLPELG
jgi:predicted permease